MRDLLLGVESSCDDTCACLMSWVDGRVIYNRSLHQDDVHRSYGGIVPNLAAEAHFRNIDLIKQDLQQHDIMRIACIACTVGPGLIGSLLVGLSFAKGLAMSLGVPLLRINHLEGHAVSCMIDRDDITFPYLLLLASGGNSQIILAKDLGQYRVIGQTLDDACGEALDKIAKYLSIGYPGGVNLEKTALTASDKHAFVFKDGGIHGHTLDFSFSGLKTQVMYKVKALGGVQCLSEAQQANLAYAAQEAVFDTLVKKVSLTLQSDNEVMQLRRQGVLNDVVICGGVSANSRLHQKLSAVVESYNMRLLSPNLLWTTDNAGMIAKAGCLYWNAWKQQSRALKYNPLDLSCSPTAKWPIDCI